MKSIAWDIWLYCNYDCRFCNSKTKILRYDVKSTEEILKAWRNVYIKYGKCKIYITGGEPLLYPDIFKIIEKLIKLHDIHITTNLSVDIEGLFDADIDKNNIFINTTFHPYYADIGVFARKLLKLREKGYDCSVVYMSDDLQMTELLNYKKVFEFSGIKMVPTEYNKNYKRNKFIFNFFENGSFCNETNDNGAAAGSGYCNAGKNYCCVDIFGDVFVCSVKKQKLGNIFNNTFSFLDRPVKCGERCSLSENKYC